MSAKKAAAPPSNPIITLAFHHKNGKGKLVAAIGAAKFTKEKASDGGEDISVWTAPFTVEFNGVAESHNSHGIDSLQPLMIALEYIRSKIPAGEETLWVSSEGEESWCVLPKRVPYAWGYPLYKKISSLVDSAYKEFMADIEKRRAP
jgi:hypothetical protein